jgi:transposase
LDGVFHAAVHPPNRPTPPTGPGVLPATPAGILTTIPHVGVVRASNYGAGVGDHNRFDTAAQVYRMSGLVPRLYESAGRRRTGTGISREGKTQLREGACQRLCVSA